MQNTERGEEEAQPWILEDSEQGPQARPAAARRARNQGPSPSPPAPAWGPVGGLHPPHCWSTGASVDGHCAPNMQPGQRAEPLCELGRGPSSPGEHCVWGMESELVLAPTCLLGWTPLCREQPIQCAGLLQALHTGRCGPEGTRCCVRNRPAEGAQLLEETWPNRVR